MGERDLAGEKRIVVRDVGIRVTCSVLKIDVHTGPELLDAERTRGPVDAQVLSGGTRIVRGEGWSRASLFVASACCAHHLDEPLLL